MIHPMAPISTRTMAKGGACLGVAAVALATGGAASPLLLTALGASVAPVCQEIAASLVVSGTAHAGRRVGGMLKRGKGGDALERLIAHTAASCVRDAAAAMDHAGDGGRTPDELRAIAKALESRWHELAGKLDAAQPTAADIARWIEAASGEGDASAAPPSPMDEDHWLALVVMAGPKADKQAQRAAASALHAGFVPALLKNLRSNSGDAAEAAGIAQQAVLGALLAQVRDLATTQAGVAEALKKVATGEDVQWALRVAVDTLRDEARAQAALLLEALRPSAPPLYMPGRALARAGGDGDRAQVDEDRFDRFLYSAQRLPVVGRETERDELARWLLDGRAFSWDLWTGPAGAGKSRLALDLCLVAEAGELGSFLIDAEAKPPTGDASRAWRTGFIEWGSAAEDAERWKAWRPNEPTLIVVDYVAERAGPLSHVLGVLARRTDLNADAPVRVLLLERDFTRPTEGEGAKLPMPDWVNRLTRHDLAKDGQLQASHARMEREAIEQPLKGVSPEAAAEIVRLEADLGEVSLGAEAVHRRVTAITDIDPALRPLFIAMAAEAIRMGGAEVDAQLPTWNPQLLAEYVQGKLLGKWDDRLDRLGVPEIERCQLRQLLALATLSRGLDAEDLRIAFGDDREGLLPKKQAWKAYARHMLLTPGAHAGYVPPLEPDVIGEAFVLELMAGDGEDGRELMRLAWKVRAARGGPRSANPGFLTRAAQNFPEHPSLGVLLDPAVEGANAERLAAAQEARLGKLEGMDRHDRERAVGGALADDDRQPAPVRALGLFASTIGRMSPEELDRFEKRVDALPEEAYSDATVRENLASGLCNAFLNAKRNSIHADGLLVRLEALHQLDARNAAVRESLAMGLYNAFHRAEPNSELASGLLVRLRVLFADFPSDTAIAVVVLRGEGLAFIRRIGAGMIDDEAILHLERAITVAECCAANEHAGKVLAGIVHFTTKAIVAAGDTGVALRLNAAEAGLLSVFWRRFPWGDGERG